MERSGSTNIWPVIIAKPQKSMNCLHGHQADGHFRASPDTKAWLLKRIYFTMFPYYRVIRNVNYLHLTVTLDREKEELDEPRVCSLAAITFTCLGKRFVRTSRVNEATIP